MVVRPLGRRVIPVVDGANPRPLGAFPIRGQAAEIVVAFVVVVILIVIIVIVLVVIDCIYAVHSIHGSVGGHPVGQVADFLGVHEQVSPALRLVSLKIPPVDPGPEATPERLIHVLVWEVLGVVWVVLGAAWGFRGQLQDVDGWRWVELDLAFCGIYGRQTDVC